MEADYLDGVGLRRPKNLLPGDLSLHDTLFQRNLLLQQILDLLNVLNVVLVYEQITRFLARTVLLLVDLLEEFTFVRHAFGLALLLQPLLVLPVLLVRANIRLADGLLLAFLDLRLVLSLHNLFHQVIFESLVGG